MQNCISKHDNKQTEPKLWTTDSVFYLNRCLHNLVNCISLSRQTSIENLFGKRAAMVLYLKCQILFLQSLTRSSPPEVFLWKDLLKICGIFTGEHPYRNVNYHTKIALRHGCSPVNLMDIFKTPFLKTPLEDYFWLTSIFIWNFATASYFW